MAIGNNHDDLVRLRARPDSWERDKWRRENWRREPGDGDAAEWTGDEIAPPSCEETVTELLTTTAGVVFAFFAIIVLVKFFG